MAAPKTIDTTPAPEQVSPEQAAPEQPSNTLTMSPLSEPTPASVREPKVTRFGGTIRIDY